MSISQKKTKTPRATAKSARKRYVPHTALAETVDFDAAMMRVTFMDGRILEVPLEWFPVLRDATVKQRARYEIGGGGIALHWPELDEDISIAGLMAGVDQRAG